MRAHLSRWKEATTDESHSAHTTLKVTPLSTSKGKIVRMITRTAVVFVAHNDSVSQHEERFATQAKGQHEHELRAMHNFTIITY